ncbi:MAG TPA: (d)CMP kinase [Steroidobacteraceae bacterium]|jgi:cytidylate kinase|nr:(d)CMP kinase [Steroidobacteraceae bacterium]
MSPIPVIAIDGPSGSGKGTIARRVAQQLGWHLLDSGALYRLVALAGQQAELRPDDVEGHAAAAAELDARFGMDASGDEEVLLAGENVTRQLRAEATGEAASRVAAWQPVRSALLGRQRAFARPPGLVADGRDMGSIVFRDSGLKIFLTASAEERALRRYKQLKEKGLNGSLAALSAEIAERDRRDTTRAVAPLVAVPEAIIVDSTALTIEEVVGRVIELARERFPEAARGN